jgi:hypothetical protein
MDTLTLIEKAYDFKELEWIIPEKSFTSNRGAKRLLYWQDKKLLEWHINWRDQLGKTQHYLVDRMIRTKLNNAYISIGDEFLTIHDEEIGGGLRSFDEKLVGAFIGSILHNGQNQKMNDSQLYQNPQFPQELLLKQLEDIQLQNEENKLLTRVQHEARKRLKLSKNLLRDVKVTAPITDKIESLDQCKSIFDMFFWNGTNQPPQNAYISFRNFLIKWMETNGEQSLRGLLSNINASFPIDQEQGDLLLAELLKPWEFIEFISKIQSSNSIADKKEAFQQFKQVWEFQRELVSVVADWIDQSRKKVVQ